MDAAPRSVCAPNIVERHVQRLRACIAKVARGAFRVPGSVTDWRRLLCCSSRVMGNYHARFLGGWARATAPGYPPPAAKFERLRRRAAIRCLNLSRRAHNASYVNFPPLRTPLRGAIGAGIPTVIARQVRSRTLVDPGRCLRSATQAMSGTDGRSVRAPAVSIRGCPQVARADYFSKEQD